VRKKREEGKGKRGERRRQVMWEKGKRKREMLNVSLLSVSCPSLSSVALTMKLKK
jgi:phosphoribosyl-AMP cyclohydrolase